MTTNMKKVFKSTKSSPALILEPIEELNPDGISFLFNFFFLENSSGGGETGP
jgi:hypothetical protein